MGQEAFQNVSVQLHLIWRNFYLTPKHKATTSYCSYESSIFLLPFGALWSIVVIPGDREVSYSLREEGGFSSHPCWIS